MLAGRRILRLLKEQTAQLHSEAEHYVRILDADATLDDYRRYLATMAGFHGPLETAFASQRDLDTVGFAATDRRKSHLLAADLEVLGVRDWAACTALPSVTTLARAIGVAYVIEGSTLGGRYILSRLPPAIATCGATAFLAGYGDATGDQWRAFGAVVQHGVRTTADECDAVAGACDAFARMVDWLALHETRRAEPLRVLA